MTPFFSYFRCIANVCHALFLAYQQGNNKKKDASSGKTEEAFCCQMPQAFEGTAWTLLKGAQNYFRIRADTDYL